MKMREAEASLSLKDLRQQVAELTEQWQKHLLVRIIMLQRYFRRVFEPL